MEKFVKAKDLCGRSATKARNILESIVRCNALVNKTGFVNYNEYGLKDGIGFVPCSEKFVDNFTVQSPVRQDELQNKNYIHIRSVNNTIRELLLADGLKKCTARESYRIASCVN